MDNEKKVREFESLDDAVKNCEFTEEEPQTQQLDAIMAVTRMKLDNSIQAILAESALPIYLFDYLLTSIQADMRKADADILRMGGINSGDSKDTK